MIGHEHTAERIRQLEAENAMLRKLHDDERDHLAALRAEVQTLRRELSQLSADRDNLKARLRERFDS